MRRFSPALLFVAVLALAGCQSGTNPEDFKVKDADFGTWETFVASWNIKEGMTRIGEAYYAKEGSFSPTSCPDYPGYRVDFDHGVTLFVFIKNDHVVRFSLGVVGFDQKASDCFAECMAKAIAIVGRTAHWDTNMYSKVIDMVDQNDTKSHTFIVGNYALNMVNQTGLENCLLFDVGHK